MNKQKFAYWERLLSSVTVVGDGHEAGLKMHSRPTALTLGRWQLLAAAMWELPLIKEAA